MSSYRVVTGTQINVEGKVYAEGEVVDLDEATAQAWLAGGLVEVAKDLPDKRYRKPRS